MPVSLANPWVFVAALVLAGVTVFLARRRRVAVHRLTAGLAACAMLLLALAAGGFMWRREAAAEVVVMVDLSASTRGAEFRDRARLEARVKELLGQTPHRTVYFAEREAAGMAEEATFADL